jgi:sugar lactone lactonase YvrE
MSPRSPDGICLDAEGCVWFGSPRSGEFVRVELGGETKDVITVRDRWAIACVLGGDPRRQLLKLSARVPEEPSMANLGGSTGFAEIQEVDVCGAGIP